MVFEYRNQPMKGLYLGYQVLSTILVRIPLWSLWYSHSFMRPRPSWSLKHTLSVQLIRHVTYVSSVTGGIVPPPDWRAVVPGDGVEGVWIDGTPELITGELKTWASISQVEPQHIPGYWYAKLGTSPRPTKPPAPSEKVFYCFHGGGYIQLSAHPSDFTANIVRSLVQQNEFASHALALEYRLSATDPFPDRFPFPAALLDAIAGYNYLINVVGYDPENVILTGDSAGGNLALALVRYLIENKSDHAINLPSPPGHLLLLSPWTDLGSSHNWPGSSTIANTMDYLGDLDSRRSLYSKEAYLRPYGFGFAALNRYISPASLHPSVQAHFNGFPRTFIAVGTAERFLDQVRTLKRKMVADMGEDEVTFFEAPDAIHDYLAFNWHPQRSSTLQAIANWLQ